jgi:small subunit ribosomal protein S18
MAQIGSRGYRFLPKNDEFSVCTCQRGLQSYNAGLKDFTLVEFVQMQRSGSGRERREKKEQFQTFSRPKLKIARTSASGKTYIDYKDTESLRKMMSGNGKVQGRKRTGATAMEQRMIARAVKRARYMALLPYVTASM